MSSRVVSMLLLGCVLLAPAPVRAEGKGKKYVLLVGVTAYDTLRNLKYTENDVEVLRDTLSRGGFEVTILTTTRGKEKKDASPTAANIRARLKAISGKMTKDDLFLICLAGHGVQLVVTDPNTNRTTKESYFCPSDARPVENLKIDEAKKTMIPVSEFFADLKGTPGIRLLLVDACRNEIKGQRARNIDPDNLPAASNGMAALFSCKGDESAYETDKLGKGHGVFFYHVIEGLKGKAQTKKGAISWASLSTYVTEAVADEVPGLIGGGAKQSPHEVRNTFGKSALLLDGPTGDGADLFRQGMDYYTGVNGKVDHVKAYDLFKRGADGGHALAKVTCGWMLRYGHGTAKDETEGDRIIKRALEGVKAAARRGDAPAQFRLSQCYHLGVVVARDEDVAADLLAKAAAQGYASAEFVVGLNKTREKNDKEALDWQRKAAAKGHPGATFAVGVAYRDGKGVAADPAEAVRWFRKSAEKEYPQAMTTLGLMHERGQGGLEKDAKEALAWYRKAADKRHPRAMVFLALMHHAGLGGLAKDTKEAFRLYRTAADLDDSYAGYHLGRAYETGDEKDLGEAFKWYRKAAMQGEPAAMVALGRFYQNGNDAVVKDEKEAVRWYRKAAELGHAHGTFCLGLCHETGIGGLDRDVKEAVRCFTKAAELGHTDAMTTLGWRCEHGKGGLDKDEKAAFAWYKKAAAKGNRIALTNLGLAHEHGRGTDRDEKTALLCYRKAAEAGHARAAFFVGTFHELGKGGLEKDEKEALKWYRKAVDGGDGGAMNNLGLAHEYGKGGLEKDVKEAVRWYKRSADAGNASGMYNLALSYEQGAGGLEKDAKEALAWFRKAADGGLERAAKKVKELAAG